MTGNYYVMEARQGETFDLLLTWCEPDEVTPIDITGWTARMQLRVSADDVSATLELTDDNGGLRLGGADGTIRISIPAETLAALTPIAYVYDIELDNTLGCVVRLLWGKFWLRSEVTR